MDGCVAFAKAFLEIVLGMDMYDTCLFCSFLMHMIPEWAHGTTLEYYVLSTFCV